MAEPLAYFGAADQAHPWDEWLDGRPWLLEHGADYKATSNSFRATINAAAKRRGGKVRTRQVDGGIVIQFYAESPADPLL